ncbi:MAG: alkaline phosphatase family protein [Chloroflexi bacterium]|nr:alkaline phosphatase family protein [Chloroflexota bacterium]MCL5110681.1 alkaline phosphatase family protein [Chloroflexota bacterium]
MPTAKKAMLLGLDAPMVGRFYKYAQEGAMPRVKQLLDNGAWGANCLPPFPSITPPNWTTLATGATLATHKITCFNVHTPGDPLDKTHQGFDSGEVGAEYIWEAAEKAGKKSIVINYPTTWPPRMKESVQIAGAGLSPNEWRAKDIAGEGFRVSLSDDQLWTSGFKPAATDIDLVPAKGWQNAPQAKRAIEAELPLEYRKPTEKVKDQTWYALVLDSDGKGFDRVLVCESKDAAAPLADLKVGQWSETLPREFQAASGPRKAAFRFKLMNLSSDGEQLELYRTALCALAGWDYPAGLAAELPLQGLPLPYPGYNAIKLGWIDVPTLNEIVELAHEWFAGVATYLLTHREWDLYYMHVHTTDWAYHVFANMIDAKTTPNDEEYQKYLVADRFMYESLDRLIGRILDSVDLDETVVLLTSDHGAKPTGGIFMAGQVLQDAGLISFLPSAGEEEEAAHFHPVTYPKDVEPWGSGDLKLKFKKFGKIDWSKTKAMVQRSCHIYVNLKGRDPQGCVDPADYETVRGEVIKALYDYTDPETGVKPIVFALRKEDARFLNFAGEHVGDVIYATSGDYHGQHGGQLGSEQYGESGDLRSLFLLSGPGVKKGVTVERTIWLQDVVPTLCYLADLPVPEQCEGAVVYQALEDPNQALNRYETLQRRYEKMRKSLDRAPMC